MDTSSAHSNFTYSHEELPDQQDDNDVELLKTKYKEGSNRVYHDFFKTKMCNLYLLNICKKGAECPFAHTDDELREKPNLYKTKLCPSFLEEGYCKRGENCNFAHGEEQLRSTPDLFKTAICNLWTQGKCFSGERCRFAHGYEDLRPAPSHHKFKKTNYNKAFNNNQNNPRGHQGHQGHQGHRDHRDNQGHQGHQGHQNHQGNHHNKQNGGGHNHNSGFNQGGGGFNQPPGFNQGPAGFNQFYSQPGFPTGPFAYPINPMFSMPPMQNAYQDPSLMGNFLDNSAGMQYPPHKNNYKKDSF